LFAINSMKNAFSTYQNQMIMDVRIYMEGGKSQEDAIEIVSLELKVANDYVKSTFESYVKLMSV